MADFTTYELWDTHTSLEVIRETDTIPSYWLDLLFPNQVNSDDEYIDFEKIPRAGRKLAPFVAPMAQGRAIYEEGSSVGRFKPAYVKPSDPVSPLRALRRRPGSLLGPDSSSLAARYEAVKVDILAHHRSAIERRWEWLAARAAIDGKVTIEGPDYPAVEVDFGRAPAHTVVKTAGARWGEAGVSILGDLRTWSNTMHLAKFGGRPNRLTVGVDVWAVMQRDPELKDLLDLRYRGSDALIRRDVISIDEARYVGQIDDLEIWVYNDFYTVGGVVTPFMSSKDIVLSSPAVDGYRCFGAIIDSRANFQALEIFPLNLPPTGDVGLEQVVSQSAPLMVPVNPNATFKATVVP